MESRILEVYVSSFDFTDTRIDEALRLYLETFRLPGEAPLIFLVMEHFAEHWHVCTSLLWCICLGYILVYYTCNKFY